MDRGANNEVPTPKILEQRILIDLFCVSSETPFHTGEIHRIFIISCLVSLLVLLRAEAVCGSRTISNWMSFQGFLFPLMSFPLILSLQHRQQFPTFLQLLKDRNAAIMDFLGLPNGIPSGNAGG